MIVKERNPENQSTHASRKRDERPTSDTKDENRVRTDRDGTRISGSMLPELRVLKIALEINKLGRLRAKSPSYSSGARSIPLLDPMGDDELGQSSIFKLKRSMQHDRNMIHSVRIRSILDGRKEMLVKLLPAGRPSRILDMKHPQHEALVLSAMPQIFEHTTSSSWKNGVPKPNNDVTRQVLQE